MYNTNTAVDINKLYKYIAQKKLEKQAQLVSYAPAYGVGGGALLGLILSQLAPKDKDESTLGRILRYLLGGAALGGIAGLGYDGLRNVGAWSSNNGGSSGTQDSVLATPLSDGTVVTGARDTPQEKSVDQGVTEFISDYAGLAGGALGATKGGVIVDRLLDRRRARKVKEYAARAAKANSSWTSPDGRGGIRPNPLSGDGKGISASQTVPVDDIMRDFARGNPEGTVQELKAVLRNNGYRRKATPEQLTESLSRARSQVKAQEKAKAYQDKANRAKVPRGTMRRTATRGAVGLLSALATDYLVNDMILGRPPSPSQNTAGPEGVWR